VNGRFESPKITNFRKNEHWRSRTKEDSITRATLPSDPVTQALLAQNGKTHDAPDDAPDEISAPRIRDAVAMKVAPRSALVLWALPETWTDPRIISFGCLCNR
jgi:hypothetical protein